MPYAINGVNIIEFQIVGRLHNQITRSVFHYYTDQTAAYANGAAAANALVTPFDERIYEPLMAITGDEWMAERITAQWIAPIRYRLEIVPGGVLSVGGGAVGNGTLPSGVSMVVSMYAEQAGKGYRGRKFFPGVPTASEANSLLSPAALTALQNTVADHMTETLTSGPYSVIPTLASKFTAVAVPKRVTAAVARNTIRYQRRREVGVGE